MTRRTIHVFPLSVALTYEPTTGETTGLTDAFGVDHTVESLAAARDLSPRAVEKLIDEAICDDTEEGRR